MEQYKGYYIEERWLTPGLMPQEVVLYDNEEKMTRGDYSQTFDSLDSAKNWIDQQVSAPKYTNYIMEKVRQHLGLEPYDTSRDEEINNMPHNAVFRHCLEWEGIIGYDNAIADWIHDIYGVTLV